jgi:hypothetical protein
MLTLFDESVAAQPWHSRFSQRPWGLPIRIENPPPFV